MGLNALPKDTSTVTVKSCLPKLLGRQLFYSLSHSHSLWGPAPQKTRFLLVTACACWETKSLSLTRTRQLYGLSVKKYFFAFEYRIWKLWSTTGFYFVTTPFFNYVFFWIWNKMSLLGLFLRLPTTTIIQDLTPNINIRDWAEQTIVVVDLKVHVCLVSHLWMYVTSIAKGLTVHTI